MENLKTAAQKLLKVADELEREAFENTYFVCEECNHTASLASINSRRMSAAKEAGIKNVNTVTVNDKISCPACKEAMSYVPTKESMKYYTESEDESENPFSDQQETPPAPPEGDEGDSEGDSGVFKPVDEQPDDGEEEAVNLDLNFEDDEGDSSEDESEGEDTPPAPEGEDTPPAPEGEDTPPAPGGEDMPPPAPEGEDMPPAAEGDMPAGEGPSEDMGEGAPEEEETDESEVIEEEVPKKKKKKDKPDDEEAAIPKEDVPKFEEMPQSREASEAAYKAAVARYSLV